MRRAGWVRKGLPFLLFEITDGGAATPSGSGGGFPPEWLEEPTWRWRAVGHVRVSGHSRLSPRRGAARRTGRGLLNRVRYAEATASRSWSERRTGRMQVSSRSAESRAWTDAFAGRAKVTQHAACHAGEARVSRGQARRPNNDAALLLLLSDRP